MRGREFLDVSRELLASGTAPRHWRCAIIHVYYALLLECREAMNRWGLPPLARQQVHAQVRLRLVFATNLELQDLGFKLEKLCQDRNHASYDLRPLPGFATVALALQDANLADDGLALLDAIDSDPLRRASAVASIKP